MNHILVDNFSKLVNKQEAVITVQVYLELCEVKKYHDIQYIHDENLRKIIITAKKTKNSPKSSFVPITVYEQLNFLNLQNYIKTISCETLFLVIVHADSTCVFYQLSNGLLEPTDTTAKHLKENKREMLDSELSRNRKLLEQSALMGLPVTLRRND